MCKRYTTLMLTIGLAHFFVIRTFVAELKQEADELLSMIKPSKK